MLSKSPEQHNWYTNGCKAPTMQNPAKIFWCLIWREPSFYIKSSFVVINPVNSTFHQSLTPTHPKLVTVISDRLSFVIINTLTMFRWLFSPTTPFQTQWGSSTDCWDATHCQSIWQPKAIIPILLICSPLPPYCWFSLAHWGSVRHHGFGHHGSFLFLWPKSHRSLSQPLHMYAWGKRKKVSVIM